MIAREIMQTGFHTLSPRDTIAEAVKHFQAASDLEQKKVFGLMVTDESDHLVGMLSMYDILLFIQPKHAHIWGEMEDIDPSKLYDERLEKVKSILVGDIMTAEVMTIPPDTHLMAIATGRAARTARPVVAFGYDCHPAPPARNMLLIFVVPLGGPAGLFWVLLWCGVFVFWRAGGPVG